MNTNWFPTDRYQFFPRRPGNNFERNGLRLEPHFDGDGLKLIATPYVESAIPALNIIRSNSGVVISWPNGFSGWELYRSADYANWQPSTVAGINNTVRPATEAKEFFRLQKQSAVVMTTD